MAQTLTYVVGDIHGRLDLLKVALGKIERHAVGRSGRLIFLGDYVDRGPDSRGVVELLMTLERDEFATCLKGNHEDLMLRALNDPAPQAMRRWRDAGGGQTLASYGVREGEDPRGPIPREHLRWIAGLPLTTSDRRRIYVHAGLLPRTPFHRQTEEACLWIRERFLRAKARDFDTHIVHGHTPLWEGKPDFTQPELLAHRTNLDTGAFASGVLTVGCFDDNVDGGPVEVLRAVGAAEVHPRSEILDPVDAR
jgi:serine/threonine protein phosphatase 1